MSERSRLRLAILRILVLSLVATLFTRLWYLQVMAGEEYQQQARDNNTRKVIEPALRGRLLDSAGRPLVRNRTSLVVTVDLAAMDRQRDNGKAVLTRLASVLRMPLSELESTVRLCGKDVPRPCYNGSPYQPVVVAKDVGEDVAFRIQERHEEFPGIEASVQAVRLYPYKDVASHVLGYVSQVSGEELDETAGTGKYERTDLVGRSGLELVYDDALRGRAGYDMVRVNAGGRVTGTVKSVPPTIGSDVVLSLDLNVQRVLEQALVHAVQRARGMVDEAETLAHFKAPAAAGVVMEVATGRVVGIASYPTYDPSVFVGKIKQADYDRLAKDAAKPLTSRATQGLFAPGSTWKIVSTAAAVMNRQASLGGSYPCPGFLEIGNSRKENFEGRGIAGRINLHTALVKSCDTIFYQFAVNEWSGDQGRVGAKQPPVEGLQKMARAFGFGSKTGVDLPSESAGRVVDRAFKRQRYDANKAVYCQRAKSGYPDVADPVRRAFLEALARENCTDGWRYNAGDHANLSIGQGETVATPLQLAVAYAALANGGTVFEPRLAKAIVGPDGKVVREIPPKVKGKVPATPELLAYMRDALAQVPVDGTAVGAFAGFPLGVLPIAGKTGTAQVNGKSDTSWFASYAPANAPKYAVVVMTEEAGQGGRVSAPAVREVYEGIYGLGGKKAALPGGQTPTKLPTVLPDGTVLAPGVTAAPSAPAALPQAMPALPVERRWRRVS